MADDEPMDDAPQLSDTASSEDGSQDVPIESLVSGRERRKTAGNRYDRGTVLEEAENAEDQDEVTLLFADNEEEDEEFKSDAEDEDAEMSSSDDDDQGPNAAADDMEGEQELQKQAKQERSKKRKAELALTSVAGMRKKLKRDPTKPAVPIPAKPSKKKERVTWVHDEKSGRSSLRKQTLVHREETIARLKESEAQSKKLKALKEKRDREKARDAPKELTQADRLAEAARVERQNAKSLNRWEAGEKKRQEEQAAKLAALRDKKLEGPVITWLSQKVKWRGRDLSRVADKDVAESTGPKKRGRKSKAELEQIAADKAAESIGVPGGQPAMNATTPITPSLLPHPRPSAQGPVPETIPTPSPASAPSQPQIAPPAPEQPQDYFLKGIHEYANLQVESNASSSKPATPALEESDIQQDTEIKERPQQEDQKQPETDPKIPLLSTESGPPAPHPIPIRSASSDGTGNVVIKAELPAVPASIQMVAGPGDLAPQPMPVVIELESVPEPPVTEEDCTRELLILEKFDELSGDARQEYSFFYNKKTTTRTVRGVKQSQELCPITTLPVRYRDPSTGIAYANAAAYKKLQESKHHKYAWSSMLGCYVGLENGVVARGVPEGFA